MALAPFIGPASKAGKAVKAAAKIATRTVKVKLKEPRPAEGERGVERTHDFRQKQDYLHRASEQERTRATSDLHRDPNLTRGFRREANDTVRRYVKDPEKQKRLLERIKRSDVDHKVDLRVGGQDIRSNLTFTERGANRSAGAQIGNQTRDVPDGTPIHFE
jgi:hypothetical protein